ncbi:MAG: hypothetical protein WC169_05470 [Dehalococcoidia bacterium]
MTLKIKLCSLIVISLICLAATILPGLAPAIADNNTASVLPYSKTWGNSTGRTGCNATGWGRSDTTMGCSGVNNSSKCFFVPCKYCRR